MMKFVNTLLPTVVENLALDEALLEAAESGLINEEVLRVWHAQQSFVVLGRSSRFQAEVNCDESEKSQTPIFRRVSGGTSIVAGPGCMFYAVLLDLDKRPHLRMLDQAHHFVMAHLIRAIRPLRTDIHLMGNCDLAILSPGNTQLGPQALKVSGNSLRVCRRWLLYHGTLLIDMDLNIIEKLLKHPPREPEYRAGRSHHDFLANLHVNADALCDSLCRVWQATQPLQNLPCELLHRLVEQRYSQSSWNFER